MRGRRSQGGYVLPVVLLLLACTLLWGSAFLLTLSDQFDESNDLVKQEQSWLLARSGWNLAIQQLEETGTAEDIQLHKGAGTAEVTVQQQEDTFFIQVAAEAGGYTKQIFGTAQLTELTDEEETVSGYRVDVIERVV